MDILKLKELVNEEMKKNVDAVISGDKPYAHLLYTKPNDVIVYLKSIGYDVSNHDIDTNGWQWDYWINFEINNKKYMLSGDGFYQDSATFSINID